MRDMTLRRGKAHTLFFLFFNLYIFQTFNANGEPLTLHNDYELEKISFLNSKKEEIHFYGNKLKKYVESGQLSVQTKNSYQSFFSKYSMAEDLKPYWYYYCKDESEARGFALKKNSPRLTWSNGQVLPDGKYVYVVKDNVVYAGLKIDKADPEKNILRFGHSSFFRGANVDAAGKLYIKNSALDIIDNISGHYKPGKESLVKSLRALSKLGTDFSKSRILLFHSDDRYTEIAGVRTSKTVKDFLQNLKTM